MQAHSHGRSEGDEAPGNRRATATERGRECAKIRRPGRALNAGAPRGRMADAAAALSARMPRHSRGRRTGSGGARTQRDAGPLAGLGSSGKRRPPAMDGRGGAAPRERRNQRGKRHRGGRLAGDAAPRMPSERGPTAGRERSARRRIQWVTPAGAEASDGTPRHDSVMPRGFAEPGPAERKASEAPGSGGVPRRSARGIEAQAAARGERARAPRAGVAAGCPAGCDVSDWGEAHPGGAGSLYGCEGDHVRDGTCQEHPRRPGGIWIWHGGAPPGCKAQSTRWATCW